MYRRFHRIHENEIDFCYDNLDEILHNLDPEKCRGVNQILVNEINRNVKDDFSRIYIDPEYVESLIKEIKSYKIGIENELYDGDYISWNVKIYNPAKNFNSLDIEDALEHMQSYSDVELAGRNNGHLILRSTGGGDMFELDTRISPVEAFLKFFDLFYTLNEDFIEGICDDYKSVYDMVEVECSNILYDKYGCNDEWLAHAWYCPIRLDKNFVQELKQIDTEINKFMKKAQGLKSIKRQ